MIYGLLLTKRVAKSEISEALVDALWEYKGDNLDIPKLLLENSALVGHDSCAACDHAFRTISLVALRLFSQYMIDDKTASEAFEHARVATPLSSDVPVGMSKCLLQCNIDATYVSQAIIRILEAAEHDEQLVQLLLTKNLDPNQEEGQCLMLAAAKRAEVVFRQPFASLWSLVSGKAMLENVPMTVYKREFCFFKPLHSRGNPKAHKAFKVKETGKIQTFLTTWALCLFYLVHTDKQSKVAIRRS